MTSYYHVTSPDISLVNCSYISGVICVTLVEQILSIALSFAAGAMIWVVCNDIVPEASAYNHTRLCSIGVIVGFVVMMCLDTALA